MTMAVNNLFDFFSKVDSGNFDAISKLSDAEKKSMAPIVLMRWLSGTASKKQILHINHILNPVVFDLYKHQDLLFQLMVACSDGTSKRYKWIKKESKIKKKPITLDIIQKYYECSMREAEEYINSIKSEDIMSMALALGEDKSIIDKLKKE